MKSTGKKARTLNSDMSTEERIQEESDIISESTSQPGRVIITITPAKNSRLKTTVTFEPNVPQQLADYVNRELDRNLPDCHEPVRRRIISHKIPPLQQ